jgi:hypothetical protein
VKGSIFDVGDGYLQMREMLDATIRLGEVGDMTLTGIFKDNTGQEKYLIFKGKVAPFWEQALVSVLKPE